MNSKLLWERRKNIFFKSIESCRWTEEVWWGSWNPKRKTARVSIPCKRHNAQQSTHLTSHLQFIFHLDCKHILAVECRLPLGGPVPVPPVSLLWFTGSTLLFWCHLISPQCFQCASITVSLSLSLSPSLSLSHTLVAYCTWCKTFWSSAIAENWLCGQNKPDRSTSTLFNMKCITRKEWPHCKNHNSQSLREKLSND